LMITQSIRDSIELFTIYSIILSYRIASCHIIRFASETFRSFYWTRPRLDRDDYVGLSNLLICGKAFQGCWACEGRFLARNLRVREDITRRRTRVMRRCVQAKQSTLWRGLLAPWAFVVVAVAMTSSLRADQGVDAGGAQRPTRDQLAEG